VITQSAALLPVLGLLALAAKVTKLKLSQNQNTGYGGGGGGYGHSQGGGHGGYGGGGGFGSGGGGGGFGHYSSFHHKRIGRRAIQGQDEKVANFGQRTLERPRRVSILGQPRSSGLNFHSSSPNLPEMVDQSSTTKELDALEEIFKTINLLVR